MRLIWQIVFGLALFGIRCVGASAQQNLSRDLLTCVRAWNVEEFPTVCQYFRKDGKVIPIGDFQNELKELKEYGIPKLHIVAGSPNEPREVSPRMFTVIPILAVASSNSKRVGYFAYLYAYSSDQGHHWLFENLFKSSQQSFDIAHPELKGTLTIPLSGGGVELPAGIDIEKIELSVPNQPAHPTLAKGQR